MLDMILNIAYWALVILAFVFVVFRTKSLSKGIQTLQALAEAKEEKEVFNNVKVTELAKSLKEAGISDETIAKMLAVADSIISVKEQYIGSDAQSKYLQSQLVKMVDQTTKQEVYYTVEKEVK